MIYYHVNKRKLQMIWIFMKMMKTMRYQDQGLIIMPIPKLVSKILKKMKYVCPECNIKLWGKPNLNIICGDCNTALQLS